MTTQPTTEKRNGSAFLRRVGTIALAGALLAGPLASSQMMLTPSVSQAATPGAGIYDGSGSGIGALVHSDGTVVYCLEMGHIVPDGTDAPLVPASALPGFTFQGWMNGGLGISGAAGSTGDLSGDGIEMLKYILGNFGTTTDNDQAAAVQLAVWDLRTSNGDAGYAATIGQVKAAVPASVVAWSDAMIAEAAAYVANPGTGTGVVSEPGAPVLNSTSPYAGTTTVEAGTTWLQLQNGRFTAQAGVTLSADGTRATITDGQAHTLQWEGTPGADADYGRYYRVTLTGGFDYTVSTPGELVIGVKGGLNQTIGIGRPPVNEQRGGEFKAQYVDPDTFWAPTLTTVTETKLVKKGEKYSDVITFKADPEVGSGEWRWMLRDGKKAYAPITATGTVYGPFLQDPAENPSGTVPQGAPKIGTSTVTTSEADGPGKSYTAQSDAVAQETGYITWVWEIVGDKQLPQIIDPSPVGVAKASSLPKNYHFVDGYGQATESQWTPTELDISTQLSDSQITIGDNFTDDVTVDLASGGWLQTDGKRTPATLRGTVYSLNEKPKQQAKAPADAVVLAESTVSVDRPGQSVTSDAFSIPMDTSAKYITVQWCLTDEDQAEAAKTKFKETCDDFGVPAETAEILRPEVTTQSQETGTVYGDISDTAYVTGTMLDPKKWDSKIDFTAYLKPEVGQPKYDENWKPVLDESGEPVLWTADEVSDPEAVCAVQPVGKTEPVSVSKTGEYKSGEILAKTEGTVYWVEELRTVNKENPNEEYLVHRGICGLPNETTQVEKPKVTTQAQELGAVKGDITDTAKVEGPLSTRDDVSYEIDFTAYLKPEAGQPKYDENWKPVLDKAGEPVLWTADEVSDPEAVCAVQPVGKTDRVPVAKEGEYVSPTIKTGSEGTVYWVEELYITPPPVDEEPPTEELVHRGICGLPNETTEVEEPKVVTKATPEAVVGDVVKDTAIVTGPLSDRDEVSYSVSFQAFHQPKDATEPVCLVEGDDKNVIFETTDPTRVTGEGEFDSEDFTVTDKHIGEIFWVETLTRTEAGDTEVVHVGKCGEVDEITKVSAKPAVKAIASTGSDISLLPIAAGLGGLIALAGAAALLLVKRNRGKAADLAVTEELTEA